MPRVIKKRCTECDGVSKEGVTCDLCYGYGQILEEQPPLMDTLTIDWHELGLCRAGGGNNFHCGCKYNG